MEGSLYDHGWIRWCADCAEKSNQLNYQMQPLLFISFILGYPYILWFQCLDNGLVSKSKEMAKQIQRSVNCSEDPQEQYG